MEDRGTLWDCLSFNSQPPAPGHPDWDGQADARRPRPWLAPGMWHPRIPLSSRMSRAARAASPVRDPPGAALTWVRRCLYGRCDPGSAVSTHGPKAGQRAAAGCDAARTHAGGAVLTFAQQQQQAAGSSSLSLHVLLDSSSDID